MRRRRCRYDGQSFQNFLHLHKQSNFIEFLANCRFHLHVEHLIFELYNEAPATGKTRKRAKIDPALNDYCLQALYSQQKMFACFRVIYSLRIPVLLRSAVRKL